MLMEMGDGGGVGAGAGLEPETPPHPDRTEKEVTQTKAAKSFCGASVDGRCCVAMASDNARRLPAADKVCELL
jgi:hypothetical protein